VSAKSRGIPRPLQAAIAALVGIGLAAALWLSGVLDPFEGRTWDMREQLLARPGAATPNVVTILLDQASLDWVQNTDGLGWPWPRELYSAIVDFCRRGGAKALAFDVLFTEPSTYGVSDDQRFADSIRSYGKVVGAMLLGSKMANTEAWPKKLPSPGLSIGGFDAWLTREHPREIGFPRAQFPIPELASAFAMLANTNLPPDATDGVYRREPLFGRFDGHVLPTEALAVYLVGEGKEHSLSIRPRVLTIDGRKIPIDSDGRAILRFRGPSITHKSYSAQAVLQSEQQMLEGKSVNLDPSVLKGAYVFFGFTASGLFDLKPTPMSGSYPGVEINATMLDNLLSSDFERPMTLLVALAIIALLGAAAALAVSRVSGALGNAIVYLVFIPVAPALGFGVYALGYWMPVVPSELAVLVSLVGSSLLNYATEGRQKRYLKGAFRQYLSPAVIEQLIAHPERLELGGEKRELTIFFSDIQGFTTISETLSPEELTALLNDYLTAMVDIIQEEGGTIDKFEGDAIIAFWNAPIDLVDHAIRGVRTCLRCQKALADLRPAFRARVGKDMHMRVGMNSGPAVVGNMGSRTRFDYTMLGDAVNLAARLEGVNKQFGTYTMISRATLELLGGAFPARELSRIAVVGRKEPVTVYEPMYPEEYESRRDVLESFGRALALYYEGDFAAARAAFDSTADRDPPAARYAERCRELEAAPPPAGGWKGVWVMTSK
jgi:adenylate cyclase